MDTIETNIAALKSWIEKLTPDIRSLMEPLLLRQLAELEAIRDRGILGAVTP